MSIIRKVSVNEVPNILMQVSDALKPLNIKVLSDYQMNVNQLREDADVVGVNVELRFYKEEDEHSK